MKLKSLAALKPVPCEMTLLHPATDEVITNEAGEAIKLQLVGLNSAQFSKAKFESLKRRANADEPTESFEREDRAHYISAFVIGWSDDEFFGGAFSKELAFSVFAQAELSWLADQVEAHVVQRSNFFAK